MKGHQDADFICQGFQNGFRLGYEGKYDNVSGVRNSASVSHNVEVALEKIHGELDLDRIAGPFPYPPFDNFKCSPLALREKSTPGKFRLLHNLSYPYDLSSVNLKGADPLILVKISFFFLLENSLHVWGHYVLHFYKAIATRNAPKKGPKNGGFR